MLNVNTIEFKGRKACINSYSDHPALAASLNSQRETFAARFPNATVKTERMTEADTRALVGDSEKSRYAVWEIGYLSNGQVKDFGYAEVQS